MTLNTLSNKWLESSGSATGFMFKSTVTGKVFKAVSKTAGGKFFCVLNGAVGDKEALLDGTVDRYTMSGGSSRITEINAEISKLEVERDAIEEKIAALDAELEGLENVG